MTNTVFEYLYRDASNYKEFGEIVLKGEFTPEQDARLRDALNEKEWFVPSQLDVPSAFLYSGGKYAVNDDDHGFHEAVGFSLTYREATDPRTVEEFVLQAEKIGPHGWQPLDPYYWT